MRSSLRYCTWLSYSLARGVPRSATARLLITSSIPAFTWWSSCCLFIILFYFVFYPSTPPLQGGSSGSGLCSPNDDEYLPTPSNHAPALRICSSPTHPRSHPTLSSDRISSQVSTSASRPSRCARQTVWQRSVRQACASAVAPWAVMCTWRPRVQVWRRVVRRAVGGKLPRGCWRWQRERMRFIRFGRAWGSVGKYQGVGCWVGLGCWSWGWGRGRDDEGRNERRDERRERRDEGRDEGTRMMVGRPSGRFVAGWG